MVLSYKKLYAVRMVLWKAWNKGVRGRAVRKALENDPTTNKIKLPPRTRGTIQTSRSDFNYIGAPLHQILAAEAFEEARLDNSDVRRSDFDYASGALHQHQDPRKMGRQATEMVQQVAATTQQAFEQIRFFLG